MKITKLGWIALSALFIVGCGSSNGQSDTKNPTAKEILVGKVLYSADEELDEPTGYYRDIYSANTVVETQHAEDGTSIYEAIVLQASYSGDKITVSLGNESKTCKVTEITHGVQFICNDGSSFLEWDSIDHIQR